MRTLILLLILALSAAIALAHGDEEHDDDEVEEVAIGAVTVPENPTYHGHARSIIEARCVACHSDGQIAGYAPLTDPQDVVLFADDIKFHVVNGIMPPWMPSRANLPLKNDRSLSDVEIAMIAAWADAGAALGDSHDYVPSATDRFDLVEVRADLTLQLEEPYEPDPDVLDDYRCFALPLEIEAPQFITGYEFIPDAAEMAHHNILYLYDEAADRVIQRRNYADGRPGWSCYGGPGLSVGGEGIGGWAPGASPVAFPDGTGFLIKPGQHIVVEMHYNLWTTRQPDQSRIILRLESAESELAELINISLAAPVEIPCPAGVEGPQCERETAIERVTELYGENAPYTPDYLLRECGQRLTDYADNSGENAVGYCDFPVTKSFTLYSVSGHMHELGRSFRMELNPDSEDSVLLLDIPRWDFHWQDQYYFVEPLKASYGDVLRMTCIWDNSLSDDPRYVVWGEGTADEMCFGSLLALKP